MYIHVRIAIRAQFALRYNPCLDASSELIPYALWWREYGLKTQLCLLFFLFTRCKNESS